MKDNKKIEAYDGKYFWQSKGNKIYKTLTINEMKAKPYITVPNKYAKHSFRLIDRFLRTGIHNIIPLKDGCIVVVKKKFLIYTDNKLKKIITIPKGSRPLRNGIALIGNTLFFGDYWGNKEKEKAKIYKLDLTTFHLESILSLKARHIHFVIPGKEGNELIIGTGDKNNESKMLFFNYRNGKIKYIGKGSQKYRAVSVIQYKEFIIWGTDAPDEQNYIYRYNKKTNSIEMIREIEGPAYFSTTTKDGELYIGTTIENKNKHRAILYKSTNGIDWYRKKEFKKDIFNEKYLGYGVIEFINGQEKLNELYFTSINMKEI